MALIVPVFMLIMFAYVFGGVIDMGDINYLNFIVPGIIVQCVVNASTATAHSIHSDMTTGIIDRFRSMAISKSAVISGHVWVSVLRSMIITAVLFGVAFILGFRPVAGFTDWLIIAGVLTLFIVAVTWMVVIFGLISGDGETINGINFLLMILVFISSAFAPTDTFPRAMQVFAENQPMTPIVNTLRSLALGMPMDGALIRAIIWCVVIGVGGFVLSVQIYKAKLTK